MLNDTCCYYLFISDHIQIEPGFLAEVMEVNEEVAEAESPADLSGISEANKTVLKSYVTKVVRAFLPLSNSVVECHPVKVS